MPRFKRESWVRKMQDDYSDAYPVRSEIHPEPPMIATSNDYGSGSDWDQLKAKKLEAENVARNNRSLPSPNLPATDYRWRKMGKLPNIRQHHDPVPAYTPFISPIGYSRHFKDNCDVDIQLPRNQKYTTLTLSGMNGMESNHFMNSNQNDYENSPSLPMLKQPDFISMRSARQFNNFSEFGDLDFYASKVAGSKSVPYKGRYDPSSGFMDNLHNLALYPQTSQLAINPATNLPYRGSIEGFLDTSYKEPWRNPNARMY